MGVSNYNMEKALNYLLVYVVYVSVFCVILFISLLIQGKELFFC